MTADHFKEMAKAGTIGALTSMAYGETVGRALHTTGKEGDINDALAEYSTLKTKTQNLDKVGKIDDVTKNGKTNRENIYTNKVGELKIIEDTLKGVSEEKRAKIIKRNSLESMVEADGSIKADFAIKEGLSSIIEQTNGQEQNEVEKALASQPMKYRTAFSNDKATAKVLEKAGVTPFVGEMTSEQATSYLDFRKAIGALSQKSNGSIKYVVADSFKANAYIDSNSGTIVIGADQFENGTSGTEIAKALITSSMWQKSMIHESTHATEGWNKGIEFEKHIKSNDAEYENAVESFIERGYFGDNKAFAIKKYIALEDKLKQGKALTEQEVENYKLLASETTAIIAENVLGTESFIKKLVRDDINIAQRIMNKITDGKEAFSSLKSKDARTAYKYLTTAEDLYLKAVEEIGGKYIKGKIIGINDKDDNNDDKLDVAKESKKQYNDSNSILWEKLSKQEQAMFYKNVDELRHQNYVKKKLANGNYLFSIGNKVVETNGEFGKPSIERIVEFNAKNSISLLEDYFYEHINDGYSIKESIEFINHLWKEEVATFYGVEYSRRNSGFYKQGQDDRGVDEDSQQDGERTRSLGNDKSSIKFSLKETVEKDVLKKYGKTYRWAETGYIYKDGTRIDLSGKNEGAPGGYRTVDHRDIFDVYEDSDIQGSDAMVEFMSRGNIRVMPESPGINLQVEPTEAQYTQIQNLVENLGWNKKEFSIDFDNGNGDTIDNIHYEGNVSVRKVISDIKYYFKEGKIPYKSELSDFRYSLKEKDYESVLDNIDSFKTIEELKSYFNSVHEMINEDARAFYPHTMAELNDNEGKRIRRVTNAINLEKEAIKALRKSHPNKPKVDLDTKEKIDEVDKQYTEAIKKNDIETAKNLVEQMALLKGYSVTDYQIDHKAPYNNSYDARLDDVTTMYGEDIYGNNAAQYFGTFEVFDNESIRHIQEAKGNPNKLMTIYRAVPTSVKNNQIRNGDWVTLTRAYAENHGKSNIIGSYRVITKRVKASEIFTDGNSIHEFGYDDGKQYYYRDTTNFRKIADAITFDDNGNPIKLKDRFNYRVDDIRYSRKDNLGNSLSQEQVDFFKDSKVRDKDNNLQVVYHGTNNKFFTFDMSANSKRNVWGKGFYFAKGKGLASDYGENIIEAYLNIKNPYINGKSNLGTADYIKDKYFNEMWESSRQLGIDYITDKLDHSPIDLLQFIAEENNKQVSDILNDYGYDGIIDGAEIVAFDSNQIKLTSNLNPTSNPDIRYSLKPFAEQVDDVFSGADSTNTHLCVSENTPEILLQVGLTDKPMLITATHTKTAIGIKVPNKNIHSVDKTVFKQLPELIKNPAIIIESIKQGSLVMFVNAKDVYGNPIICAVLVDGKGNYNNIEIDANIVTSVYGKDTNPARFIQKAFDENRILYWNKKMSQGLFNTLGLQLPDNIDKLDSNVIIRTIDKKSQEKIKNNSNGLDIRYSKKEGKTYYQLTEGQLKKVIANNTKYKTYTLADSEAIINNVLSQYMSFGDKYGELSGKTKKQVIDMLWKGLNAADYIKDKYFNEMLESSRQLGVESSIAVTQHKKKGKDKNPCSSFIIR